MENLSFDQLPYVVTILTQEVNEIKQLLIKQQDQTNTEQSEKLLTVQETAKFLNLKVPTIYSKCSRNELPFMKRSKRLYFSRTELLNYLKEGRRKSKSEIEKEGDCYLSNIKKGLK